MTKNKITKVIAIALLAVVAGTAAQSAWAQTAQGLTNATIQNASPLATANDGASVANNSTSNETFYQASTDTYVSRNTDTNGDLIMSDLTVGFPLEAAVTDGAVTVLIPVATESAAVNEPVENAFNLKAADVTSASNLTWTCPTKTSGTITGFTKGNAVIVGYNIKTGKYTKLGTNLTTSTITPEAGYTIDDYVRYVAVTCNYSGTPTRGGDYATNVNGDDTANVVISSFINPKADADKSIALSNAVVLPAKVLLFDKHDQAVAADGVDLFADASATLVSDIDVLIDTMAQDVLVTAQVDYQLMFRIDGVAQGTTTQCGTTTDVASTPMLINYGAPTVNEYVDAAQQIYVNSSVAGGYKITMTQNRNMRRDDVLNDLRDATQYNSSTFTQGQNDPSNSSICYDDDGLINGTTLNRDCIPNFGWPSLTANTTKAWSGSGLGYTVAVADKAGYNNETPTVNKIFGTAGTDDGTMVDKTGLTNHYYTRLATRNVYGGLYVAGGRSAANEEPIAVAGSTGIATGDLYDVCYRLQIDAENNAGVYENEVTYTITASL